MMTFSMERSWIYKYHMHPALVASFYTEQEFVDHMFIWLIYANYGVLLSVEELAVAA
jgi:hypothetical protein